MFAAALGILRMEVVELIFGGHDLNNGQRARIVVANDAHGKLSAFNECFEHSFLVNAQSQIDRAAQFVKLMDDRHAKGAALGRGLHHARNADFGGNLFKVFVIELVALANNGGSSDIQAGSGIQLFRLTLVHGLSTRKNARTCIRNAYRFEEALNRAVFAAFTMQRQERDVIITVDELLQIFLHRGVDKVNSEASFFQRIGACCAGIQRHLALAARAAIHHSDGIILRVA